MPITVQQFDFIAEINGIGAALAAAEQAGGVTGSRAQDTQVQIAADPLKDNVGLRQLTPFQSGQYPPGTFATDTSRGIGAVGTTASAGGVGTAAQQEILRSIMDAASQTGGVPPSKGDPTSLLERAQNGEIFQVSEVAALGSDQRKVAELVIGSLLELYLKADPGAKARHASDIKSFKDHFYGDSTMSVLMAHIATTRGLSLPAGQSWDAMFPEEDAVPGKPPGLASPPVPGIRNLSGKDLEKLNIFGLAWRALQQTNPDNPRLIEDSLRDAAGMLVPGRYGNPEDIANAEALSNQLFDQVFGDLDSAIAAMQGWYTAQEANIMADGGREFVSYLDAQYPASTYGSATDTVTTEPLAPGAEVERDIYAQGVPEHWGDIFGGVAENRLFGQIYPGFASLLPGANNPLVGRTMAGLQSPMEAQYLAQLAMGGGALPGEEVGFGPGIKGWLESTVAPQQAGTPSPFVTGNDYWDFLNRMNMVLTQSPTAGAPLIGPAGAQTSMSPEQFGLLQQYQGDPAAQVEAFMNPFYAATRGRPHARDAMFDHIMKSAERYQYQNPTGQFLPWAIDTNLGGIQGLFGTPPGGGP